MDVTGYAARLRRDMVTVGQAGGEEVQAAAERMADALDSSIRLVLLDALVEAAGEITAQLPAGSVEVRLLGREVQFAVTSPDAAPAATPAAHAATAAPADEDGEEGGTARLSLRLPERLKPKLEQAAAIAGLSVNAWLVRSIGALVESPPPPSAPAHPVRTTATGQRQTGWAR